jgi:hypothetical protein
VGSATVEAILVGAQQTSVGARGYRIMRACGQLGGNKAVRLFWGDKSSAGFSLLLQFPPNNKFHTWLKTSLQERRKKMVLSQLWDTFPKEYGSSMALYVTIDSTFVNAKSAYRYTKAYTNRNITDFWRCCVTTVLYQICQI